MDTFEPQANLITPQLVNGEQADCGDNECEAGANNVGNRHTIEISSCGSTYMLWRAAELKTAREAGIIGTLVGSLARQPRQNSRLGRPLQLKPEEARLLVDIGKAEFLPAAGSVKENSKASTAEVSRNRAELDSSFEEQSKLALQERKTVLLKILTDKQRGTPGNSDRVLRDRLAALDQSFSFPRSAMAVQICTARAGMGHFQEERHFLGADRLGAQDERSETRFRVFRDLRRRGFYLTSAGKFGGDYLVYPGDPLRYHAHFIALCVAMDATLPLCDMLALTRLGANVKKTVLLCSPGNSSEVAVEYTSLQWSGMV